MKVIKLYSNEESQQVTRNIRKPGDCELIKLLYI